MKRTKKRNNSYSGYMKLPLLGVETKEEFESRCEFYGDFANPHKRSQILNKPRKYTISFWIKLTNSNEYIVTDVDFKQRATMEQLAVIMHELGTEEANDLIHSGSEVDFENSFFKFSLHKG